MNISMLVIGLVMSLTVCGAAPSAAKITKSSGQLRIGAFNIKTFGRSKMSKPEVAENIKNIVLEYDLILIQEIRDATGDSYRQLLGMINSEKLYSYKMVISERLGRTSYKEQYAYFYRNESLVLLGTHQYADDSDEFEREPYGALFQQVNDGLEFAVIGIHAKPDDAVNEIGLLEDAYNDVYDTWGVPDMIIMGDFNADCSYASESDLEPLPFYHRNTFHWLTPWTADTTTSTNTDCAYDRIVVTGNTMLDAVHASYVYHFEDTYDLNFEEMWDVSDHYPVDIILSGTS